MARGATSNTAMVLAVRSQNKGKLSQLFWRSPFLLLVACLLGFLATSGLAQVSVTTSGVAVTQNFDSMGSNSAIPAGFKIGPAWNSGTTSVSRGAAGSSGSNVLTGTSGGGSYNFGNGDGTSATDRALGFLNSSSFASPQSLTYAFTNNTGSTITALNISFAYEKYRSGSRQWTWTFFHGSDVSTNPTTAATDGDQIYAADGGNTTIINPPTGINKTVNLTGLSIANGTTYYLRWTLTGNGGQSNGQALALDNFSLTAVGAPSSALTVNGGSSATAPAMTTTYGTPSVARTITIAGSGLTADITATAPTGYEISSNGTDFGTTATFAQSGGTANGTLSVRLKASAAVGGAYNAKTITVASTGVTTVNITTAASGNTVSAAPLTITGLTAEGKIYDGTTAATFTGTAAYSGLVNGETFPVAGTPAAAFATASVGAAKTVTFTGFTAPSANYTLTQPSATADITVAPLTVTANNVTKIFGTALANDPASTAFTSTGLVNGETIGSVTLTYGTGAATGDAVGNYPGQVVPSAAAGGTFTASNYTITYVAGDLNVDASPTIIATGTLGALTTTYGTASAPVSFTVSGGNLTGAVTVSAPANFEVSTTSGAGFGATLNLPVTGGTLASTPIFVRLSGAAAGSFTGDVTLSGGGALNRAVTIPSSTVSAKSLTITGLTATSKVYNANTDAAFTGTGVLNGVIAGDEANVTLTGSGTATFATAGVGTAKTVNVTGFTLGGTAAANYSLTTPTVLQADITAAPLTISGLTVTPKAYNGNNTATVTGGTLNGVQGTDNVGFTVAATFADQNVGTGIAVNAIVTLTGTAASNYTITQPTGLTGNITKGDQTITFNAIPAKQPTDPAFNPGATASSGLAVSYASDNAAVATVSGSTVTITGAGTANITASQTGSSNYNAATPVVRQLTVAAVSGPTTLAAGDVAIVGFSVNAESFAVVLLRDIGKDTVINFTDNGFNSPNTGNATEGFLTYTAPSAKPAGTVLQWVSGMDITNTGWNVATSPSFALSNTADQLFVFQGATTGWATQSGIKVICGGNFGSALVTSGSNASTSTYQPSSDVLPATAFVNIGTLGTNGYFANGSASATTVTVTGNATTLLALFVDPTKWFVQSSAVTYPTFNISMAASQTVTFAPLAAKTFGDAPFSLTASASSGLEVTFSSSNQQVATVSGNTVTIVGAGTTTITASQAGNGTFGPASTPQTLTVNKANQTITFDALTNRTFGDATFNLTGTSTSSQTVSFASSNQAVATISGNAVTIVGAGTTTITASQAGNTNYNAATDVPRTLTIDPKALTVTADGVTKAFGLTLAGPVVGSTAFSSSGLVPGNVIDSVTITYGTGSAAGATVGTYPGSVVASAPVGTTFNAANYNITFVAGDIIVSSDPILSVSGPLTGQTTTYGTASSGTSFIVSGGNLTGNVTVSAPAGFELQGGGSPTFGTTVSLTPAGNGTLAETVTLRLAATAAANPYSGNVSVSGGGAQTRTLVIPASTVQKAVLTIDGLTGTSRAYDTTKTASFTGTPSYVGLKNGETFSVTGTATAEFANKTVGTAKPITVSGYTAPSANYTVTQPSLSANITAVALTVNNPAVTTKNADGTNAATITGTLVGVLSTDNVTFVGTGTFASVTPGTGIAVTSTSTLGGTDAVNYTLTQPTGLTGTILADGNKNLASLVLSSGTLTPTFNAATVSYTANVTGSTETITVTPTTASAGATVKVNNTTVISGSASGAISLNIGDNTISVEVTAADLTTKIYTVLVNRGSSFTPGNFVVERLGDGGGSLGPAAAAVSIFEYAAGSTTPVQSFVDEFKPQLPNQPIQLTEAGSSTANGYLASYGGYLAIPGLNIAPATASANTQNNKVSYIFDSHGAVSNRVLFPTGGESANPPSPFAGSSFRSVVPVNATSFYAGGTATSLGGVWYYNGTSFTQLNTANVRNVGIFGGQLYYATAGGVSKLGTGLPTATSQSTLVIEGGINAANTTASTYGFVFFDTNNDGTPDRAYIADDRTSGDGGLRRFDFDGTTWTNKYSLLFPTTGTTLSSSTGSPIRGLAGTYSNGVAKLVATTAELTANRVVSVQDSGPTPTDFVTMATAPANYIFRGVANAPEAPPSLPDLTVSVSAPPTVFTGADYDYTITVTNSGTANATGVAVDFTLPANLTFFSVSGTDGFDGTLVGGVVKFIGGSLDAGASATLKVTVNAATAATYTAAIGAAVVDPLGAILESSEANNASAVAANTNVSATAVAPQITSQPASTGISKGATASLSVTATGSPTPSYQWYRGERGDATPGNEVSGAISANFTTPVLIADAKYWVRVTNNAGSVDSQNANITVTLADPVSSSNLDITKPNRLSWNTGGVNFHGTQFVNLGLQGVGRVPANSVDSATGETLGSISDMQVTNFVNNNNGSWTGTFNFLPDRGYNSGTIYSNYAARLNVFNFTFTPYTATAATTAQNQIVMTFQNSTRFTYDHDGDSSTAPVYTTGLNATGTASLFGTTVPVAAGDSTQSDGTVTNRLTLDSEGLVFDNRPGKNGAGWIGDEYGASIYHFNSAKQIDGQLILPAALIPHKLGATNFNGTPDTGRRDNQGMEGIAQSPDGTKLFGLMQSATVQDSGSGNEGRYNTRLMVFDISGTDTPTAPIAQYVIQLPRIDTNNDTVVDRTGAQSSILALNDHQLLILTRDGNGRGATGSPAFKSIILADLEGATELGTAYDSEGAQVAVGGVLKPAIIPMSWTEALNLLGKLDLNISEVEKFGLNFNTAPGDINSICEKWEALALVSAQDPANPNDYFLFVGNDNDFLTANITYLDAAGAQQTANGPLENDTVVLAYRVRMSGPEMVVEQPAGTDLKDGTSSVSFGDVPFDSTATREFTVKNTGTADLTGLGITITGADAGLFTVTANPTAPLAAANSTTFSVKFTPGSLGDNKSAVLHIASNDFDEGSFDINLTGNGAQLVAPTYQLQNATYSVVESAGTLTVNVVRTGSTPAADVTLATTDGTALAGVDFTVASPTVHFNQGETTAPLTIAIANRADAQGTRNFTVALTAVPNGSSIGTTATATVAITDAGGAGTFTFAAAKIDTNPLAPTGLPGSVQVVVNRTGSASGAAAISITAKSPTTVTKPLVALNNTTDYTLSSNFVTLSFADGQVSKTLTIPLKATVRNGQFQLTLSAPTNGATVGGITSATVEVLKKDTTNPTLNVTFGPATNGQATISGTATDGGTLSTGINRVELGVVSVNTPVPTPASLPLTAGAFSSTIQLQHGANKVTVTAFDNSGRKIAKSFTYNYSNPDLTLLVGTYTGLLVPSVAPTNENSGFITVTVSKTAAVSGKLTISGTSVAFTGALDNARKLYFKKTVSLEYPIVDKTEVQPNLGKLSLSFADKTVTATLVAQQGGAVLATATALPVVTLADPGVSGVSAGQKYTLLFPSKAQTSVTAANYPQGDGYASVSVKTNGSVSAAGVLADGTAYKAAGKLHAVSSGRQNVPLHVILYKKKGSFSTELSFDITSATNNAADDVTGANSLWICPPQPKARYYRSGWPAGARVDVIGSRFTVPVGASVLPGLGSATPNAQLQFADGGLTGVLTRDFDLSVTNAFENQSTDTGLKLSITKSTGVFTGSFTPPSSSKVTFKGIILQEGSNQRGFGFFLSTPVPASTGVGLSGGVTLTPLQ